MKSKIIPYTQTALRRHLHNNVSGLTDHTIDNILDICEKVNKGKLSILDKYMPGGIPIAEMLADLQIDYTVIPAGVFNVNIDGLKARVRPVTSIGEIIGYKVWNKDIAGFVRPYELEHLIESGQYIIESL